ncbi:probable methyltransferase TCM_000168 [Lolium perenne]|uniref:probable methyltransferase TCM_000168 n=1 Tax=Lolium perenne TaxID=4522 RepID=UPI003A9A4C0D
MEPMNQGEGDTSYARNSSIQNAEQNRMKPMIEAAIIDLCSSTSTSFPRNMVIADLGCSSGPNALVLVSTAIEAIQSYCVQFQRQQPEVCIFLNDLPNNDFNMVVKSLAMLRKSNEPIVVASVTPGSFYERLFSTGSLHLVCSSSSLHWLSKAPEVLTRNHIPAYNIDEHARREMLPMIHEAYAQQFKNDFTHFLKLRAKEFLPGGRMVISITGRHSDGIDSKLFHIWEPIGHILSVMALEGVINKAKYDSFYIPMYGPSNEELRGIIQEEGSFSIKEMVVRDLTSDADFALFTPYRYMSQMRAVFEPVIVKHFGEVMEEFMRTAERRWSLDGILRDQLDRLVWLSVSLTKA